MNTEIKYRLMKLLESNPNLTQRQMAEEKELSLGKFNYCIQGLVKAGIVRIDRFKTSDNKAAYMYLLTPKGINEKAKVTANFLKRKLNEYDQIKQDIELLKKEVGLELTSSHHSTD